MATSALVVVFAAVIGLVGWVSLQAIGGNLPIAGADARSQNGQATSTPKNEWRQGLVPILFQTDPLWASVRYAENNFGESGCGPTCMAMVYVALTGNTDKDPAAMAAFATENGYASADGTSWSFMTDGAATLGLVAEELPADESLIRRSIVAGKPVICSMGPGDFTSVGHFIVLTDIDQNGNLVVNDPNSPERSAKTWSFETVLAQSRNIWSYSLV
ncbi:MAG: C39 family peptidase [Raoultibacter sp.]